MKEITPLAVPFIASVTPWVGHILRLCTYHLLCMNIFSPPLVKSSRFTSSEKPSLTTSFTLSLVYIYCGPPSLAVDS